MSTKKRYLFINPKKKYNVDNPKIFSIWTLQIEYLTAPSFHNIWVLGLKFISIA